MSGNGRPTGPGAAPRLLHPVPSEPAGAEVEVLAQVFARGVASMAAAERSFNSTASTLVDELRSLKSEVDEIKAVVLRIEAAQRAVPSLG